MLPGQRHRDDEFSNQRLPTQYFGLPTRDLLHNRYSLRINTGIGGPAFNQGRAGLITLRCIDGLPFSMDAKPDSLVWTWQGPTPYKISQFPNHEALVGSPH